MIVFVYLWLPFMVLPVYGALERIPGGLLEASGDLGGKGFTTFRRVVLPLALPGVVAGSIFTFSLTLGDFLTPVLVGNTQFIGNVIYSDVGTAGNLPAAAAYATVPIAIMTVYLLVARAPRRVREPLMETRSVRDRAALVGRARDAVPVHPGRDHLPVRVQPVGPAGVADHGALDALVLARCCTTPRSARRSVLSLKAAFLLVADRDRCSAAPRPSRSRASASSGASRSRCCWCCRSRCRAS